MVFTDNINNIQWTQNAWDGSSFQGRAVPLSWQVASEYFGRGINLWTEGGSLSQDMRNKSDKSNGYRFGSKYVKFQGGSNWRLPTCQEVNNLYQCYDGVSSKFTFDLSGKKFWTANSRDYYENAWYEIIRRTITLTKLPNYLVAWSFLLDDRKRASISDIGSYKDKDYSHCYVILVRDI